jgi:hypothetical protein
MLLWPLWPHQAVLNGLSRLWTTVQCYPLGALQKSRKPLSRMTGYRKQVKHITFSPNGTLIASAAPQGLTIMSSSGRPMTATNSHSLCEVTGAHWFTKQPG